MVEFLLLLIALVLTGGFYRLVNEVRELRLTVDSAAGPYCGHGERRPACPYFHPAGE